MRDDLAGRVARRAVTVPVVLVATSVVWSALPFLFAAAVIVDVVGYFERRRGRLNSLRILGFVLAFLTIESAGLGALLGVWLGAAGDVLRLRRYATTVQGLYTRAHFEVVRFLFQLRFEVDGQGDVTRGPVLLLLRPASIIDTLIPGVFVAAPNGMRLRYVLKRELLWGPCLDIAGHFLENHFVDRSGVDSAKEIERVRALGTGLGRDEGVVLYPEGTRFSPSRRQALLDKTATDPVAHARVDGLEFLLPVRLGGALALLEAARGADLVVVAHTGLEGFAKVTDIWRGDLVGHVVKVKFTRIAAADVPAQVEERREFLDALWRDVDAWIRANRAG